MLARDWLRDYEQGIGLAAQSVDKSIDTLRKEIAIILALQRGDTGNAPQDTKLDRLDQILCIVLEV